MVDRPEEAAPEPADRNRGPDSAVALENGCLLLKGPAGTGKSTAIRRRVVRLAGDGDLDPSRIPVITSTVRAAGEHRAGLEAAMARPFEEVVALTWEDFAERLLRRWPVEAGLGPGFEVVGRAERLAMLLVRLDQLPLRDHQIRGNPAALLRMLVNRIDRVKQNRKAAPADLDGLLEAHDAILTGLGLIDRTDLPGLAARMLRSAPGVAGAVSGLHPHLVIDELEDLTAARADLLAALAGTTAPRSIVAALDPDRTRFDPGAEARFLASCPEAEQASATTAWRLTAGRIEVARAILGERAAPEWSAGSGGETAMPVRFWRSSSSQAEAQAAAREIEHRIAEDGDPTRIAVAVPDVDLAGGAIAAALAERGIPTRLGGGALFRQPEVRDTMAWLGALCDPNDARAVTRALARPPTSLRSVELATLTTITRRRKIDMVSACEAALESPRMPPEARQRLEGFLSLYRAATRVLDSRRPDEFVRRLIERVGFRRQRLFTARPETAERLLGLSRLADLATAFSRREPDASTREFTAYLSALAEGGLSVEAVAGLPETGGVPILDLDGVKGREWERIYVLGLSGSGEAPEPGRLATAVTSAEREIILSRVGPAPAGGGDPDDPVTLAITACAAIEEVHDEELFGPGEDLHASWRMMRDDVIDTSWRTGSELNEPRLNTPEDVNRAVARYLELLKLAALAQRPDGAADPEAIDALNGLLAQVATPEQLAELDRSTLDSWLLSSERERDGRRRLAESRREPSLAAFLPRRGGELRLSATDLDLYLTCPLKYKFARVFGIPRPPTVNMRFGILIHNVLQRFHEPALVGGGPQGRETLDDLLSEGWRRGGFGESHDELQFLDRAREAMGAYWERERSSEGTPAFLERQFEFQVGPHWLRGRADRVDRLPDDSLEVIDYKTGARIESERHGGDLQLALYRLGASEAWDLEIGSGSYYYVMEGIKETVEPAPDDRERVERTVLEVGEGVLSQDFEPRPSPEVCSWCDFRLVCPAAEA